MKSKNTSWDVFVVTVGEEYWNILNNHRWFGEKVKN